MSKMIAGFQVPRIAKDEYTLGLWHKHGLGDHPSFEDMEPVANRLLADTTTFLEGAAVVLGRRVDASEKDVVSMILTTVPTGRFGILLLQYSAEETSRK